jgi:predicted RNA binding protein YcfA (HicA-like mRNA interferase family)
MPKLPRDLSGQRAVKAFNRAGFAVDHQTGSHIIMFHQTHSLRRLTIPNHKFLKPGLLSKLIKDAGLTIEQFLDLL